MRLTAATLAILTFAIAVGPAQAQSRRVAAGLLQCNVQGGVGLILGSQRQMSCRFSPSHRRFTEIYTGRVTRVGLDIGVTGRAVMVWAVYAPTRDPLPGALSGSYAGVSAEASAGLGLGANALLGGSSRTIALQPVSVQAQTGVNLALGIAGLELRAAGR